MAWTRISGGAVELIDPSGTSSWLGTTSTGTVNLYEYDPTSGDLLRMFLFGGLPGTAPSVPPGTLARDDAGWSRITYIDSADDGTGNQRFVINETADPGSTQLKSTVIPNSKPEQDWTFTIVYYGSALPAEYSSATYEHPDDTIWDVQDQDVLFDVMYKDPSIVHLPDGKGWLMLLSRVRRTSAEIAADTAANGGNYVFHSGPNDCLSDIVAYWAEESDPGFEDASTVTGPYWIAINISTLGPDTEGIRFWLSVPAGAMISPTTLGVYFVVEATRYAYAVQGDADSVYRSLAKYDRSSATMFESCIGVHLIDIADLEAQRAAGDYGNEVDWAKSSSGGRYALPRTVGVLYLWQDDGTGLPSTELVEASDYLKVADPACSRCSLETSTIGTFGNLRFFNSAIGRGDWMNPVNRDSLHGLWMATPLATGAATVLRKDGSMAPTAAGFDWLLTTSAPFEPAQYDVPKVVDSTRTTTYAMPLDPDPVRLSTGQWRVDWGLAEDDNTIPLLAEDQNTDAEVCAEAAAFAENQRTPHGHPFHFHFPHVAGGSGLNFAVGVGKPW